MSLAPRSSALLQHGLRPSTALATGGVQLVDPIFVDACRSMAGVAFEHRSRRRFPARFPGEKPRRRILRLVVERRE